MTFVIGVDDLAPSIVMELKQGRDPDTGEPLPFDLTDCDTITFVMATAIGADPKVREAASVVGDPIDGVVQYDWVDGDTDTAGEYLAEVEVILPSEKPITFPNKAAKKQKISVQKTLG